MMMAVRTATCKHVAQGDQACAHVSAPFEASVCHLCGLLQLLFRLLLLQVQLGVQLLPRPPREGLERLVSGLLELPRPPRAGIERLVSGLLDRPSDHLIQQGRNEIMRIGI
jgi:hypothetical protein